LIIITIALAFIFLGADWHDWRNFLTGNLSIITSLMIIGLFVLFADKVLLQYFFFKYSHRPYH
jgi:Na+-transporting NADH:ubiquinone oxidoreductase subunit NqrD